MYQRETIIGTCIEKKNVPKGFGYHDRREELGFVYKAPSAKTPAAKAPIRAPAPPPKKAAPAASFAVGDQVRHKAFGQGKLVKMTPMGGDYLIEVDFEKVGVKKLMLRVAAMNMEKI